MANGDAIGIPGGESALPTLDIGAASDRGRLRAQNEDAWSFDRDVGFLIVADGVGGHGNGGWASAIAVRLIQNFVVRAARLPQAGRSSDQEAVLLRAIQFAHNALVNGGRDKVSGGTTIVGVWLPTRGGHNAIAFNVGDSALFHCAAGNIRKISRDHSLHQLWQDGGCIGTEPSKRTIVQALGISDTIVPYITKFAVATGDLVVACTDGVTGTLDPDGILAAVMSVSTASDSAAALVEAVLAGKAPDNLTAAVCKV